MKVLGAMVLHYGSDFMEYSLRSIFDHVDQILIIYTALPSYGHMGSLANPDSRDDLIAIANKFKSKVIWQDIRGVRAENSHRRMYQDYARANGFDQILIADSDEVFDDVPDILEAAREKNAYQVPIGGDRWYHFWKGFDEVCRDGFYPIRVINTQKPNAVDAENIIHVGKVYHFGYAISEKMMRYKLSCHGHKSEFNPDWLEDKWVNYKKGETEFLHPVTDAYWRTTENFDRNELPEFMRTHPLWLR